MSDLLQYWQRMREHPSVTNLTEWQHILLREGDGLMESVIANQEALKTALARAEQAEHTCAELRLSIQTLVTQIAALQRDQVTPVEIPPSAFPDPVVVMAPAPRRWWPSFGV